jgi:hypothetical protein
MHGLPNLLIPRKPYFYGADKPIKGYVINLVLICKVTEIRFLGAIRELLNISKLYEQAKEVKEKIAGENGIQLAEAKLKKQEAEG